MSADAVRGFRRERRRSGGAEELDRRNEHEIRRARRRPHDRGDARADDVADAEERGIVLERNRARLRMASPKIFSGISFHDLEDLHAGRSR